MANANGEIELYGALRSKTAEHKTAFASEIYDETQGKFQSQINQETANDGLVSAKVQQSFTNAEKELARTNIGAANKNEVLKYFDLRDYLNSNEILPDLTYNIPYYDGQPCAIKIYANDNDEDEPIHTYIAYRSMFEERAEPFTNVATFNNRVFVKTESIYEFAHPELFSANALEGITQEEFDAIFND